MQKIWKWRKNSRLNFSSAFFISLPELRTKHFPPVHNSSCSVAVFSLFSLCGGVWIENFREWSSLESHEFFLHSEAGKNVVTFIIPVLFCCANVNSRTLSRTWTWSQIDLNLISVDDMKSTYLLLLNFSVSLYWMKINSSSLIVD